MKKLWRQGKYANAHKNRSYSEEERRASAERFIALRADPEFQRRWKEGQDRPTAKAARIAALKRGHKARMPRIIAWNKTPERRRAMAERSRRMWADPAMAAKIKAAQRRGREILEAKKRGGFIPDGYEALYNDLRKRKEIPARESLKLVLAQRAADLRLT